MNIGMRQAAGLLTIVALIGGQGQPAAQPRAASVRVDSVIVEPRSQTTPVIGRLVPRRNSVVAARIDGPVGRVHADVGDRVMLGEVLAEIDPARLAADVAYRQAELQQSEANVVAAQAGLELARQELQRVAGLRGSAAFSQARFDDSSQQVRRDEGLLAVAQAQAARASVSLQQAALDLEDARIRAPFPGVVTERQVGLGEYLQAGDPVMTLINDEDLEIEASVPYDRLRGLHPGTMVTVRLDDGGHAEALVRALVPVEDPLSRTRRVRFTPVFDGVERSLAGNQSVTVMVPIGDVREVVTVHKDAVISTPGRQTVYVVVDGLAELRPIVTGNAVGGRFEVLSGLEPGEMVVVRGNERLRPGQAVRTDGEG